MCPVCSPPCLDDHSDLNIAATAFTVADIDCFVSLLVGTAVTHIVSLCTLNTFYFICRSVTTVLLTIYLCVENVPKTRSCVTLPAVHSGEFFTALPLQCFSLSACTHTFHTCWTLPFALYEMSLSHVCLLVC